jgi:HSP20 family molecular chaperone IbpA
MIQETIAEQTGKKTFPLKLLTMGELFDRMNEVYDAVARRAFTIFENNGQQLGHDLEDWLRAESEILHAVHMEVTDADGQLKVRAEVPGFTEKDLEISVEAHRLTISGKRETREEKKEGKKIYSEMCSDQIFRTFELPAEVDADKVTATLKNGVLELEMPKAETAKKIRIQARAA